MTYKDTIDFLFSQLAMYQQQGPSAYKPGLGTTLALDRAFGNPSEGLRVIHVAGPMVKDQPHIRWLRCFRLPD